MRVEVVFDQTSFQVCRLERTFVVCWMIGRGVLLVGQTFASHQVWRYFTE